MLNVLIVEDEPSYLEALKITLEPEGFLVATAANGRSGIEMFESNMPDVMLLDLMLPDLSGLDVLRRVRQRSDLPVIVVSAKSAEADIVLASRTDALLVPDRAVGKDSEGNTIVNVLVGKDLEERQVVTGISDGFDTEIISGLEAGETILAVNKRQ